MYLLSIHFLGSRFGNTLFAEYATGNQVCTIAVS